MKKYFSFDSILVVLLVAFVIFSRGPSFFKNWDLQGTQAKTSSSLVDIDGNSITLQGAYALVFWATWCKPCDVELGRIESMIRNSKLDASRVIAVSIDENLEVVKKTAQERGYNFPIHWDESGTLRGTYSVTGTPTIVVVGNDGKILWVTTGLSPSLEFRLGQYLH